MLAADTSTRSARSSLRSPGRLWHVPSTCGTRACVPPCAVASARGLHGQRGKHSANTQDSFSPASAPTFFRSSGSSRSFAFAVGSFVYQPALVGHIDANLPKEKGTNCLLAAQLCGSTRPGAVAWPGGRAASCFLVGVCLGAGHVMAPGRVSRYAVSPTNRVKDEEPPTQPRTKLVFR